VCVCVCVCVCVWCGVNRNRIIKILYFITLIPYILESNPHPFYFTHGALVG